tara:strand:- start:30 stop:338 length:309 start_codon:yes stop_codon:yes gene_type:complete
MSIKVTNTNKDYPPQTLIEDKILLLLVMKGFNPERIEFRGEEQRYVRNDYWKSIEMEILEYICKHTNVYFSEIAVEDEDCGYLYAYDIKRKKDGMEYKYVIV